MELCGAFHFFHVDITRKLDALFAIATSGLFGKIEASLNGTLFNMWLGSFYSSFYLYKVKF